MSHLEDLSRSRGTREEHLLRDLEAFSVEGNRTGDEEGGGGGGEEGRRFGSEGKGGVE